MAYGDFKDSFWRTASDKTLRDKTFNIAKNPKYNGYQGVFASMDFKSSMVFNLKTRFAYAVKDLSYERWTCFW